MSDAIDFNELKASNALPSPKGVGLNIMRLCQREDVSLSELMQQIQGDPVLAGRIIKIANVLSPNGAARPIGAITTSALILVGVHTIRQVVLGISLVTAYKNGGCKGFDYEQFWSRSLAMACAAQAIAGNIRVAPVAEMFTCALLADIGRLGFASVRPDAYARLLEQYKDQPAEELRAAEENLFGYSHTSLATAMMDDWNIPQLFIASATHHESPETSGFPEDSRQQKLIRIVTLAARMADACVATAAQREAQIPSIIEFGSTLGLDHDLIAAIARKASGDWLEWGSVLQLQTGELLLLPDAETAS